jgi:hypothetical protein
MKPNALKAGDEVLRRMIEDYTREAGVRTLERTAAKLCRKAAVKMLDEHNLEQHNRIDARSAVVVTIQITDNLIDLAEIYCFIYLPQQVVFRYETVYAEKLHLIPFRSVFTQHTVQLPSPVLYHKKKSLATPIEVAKLFFLLWGCNSPLVCSLRYPC